MHKHLTKEEHDKFDKFLRKRKIKRVQIARILGLKDGGSITQYFAKKTFRRNDFKKVKEVLEKQALAGFDEIDFD